MLVALLALGCGSQAAKNSPDAGPSGDGHQGAPDSTTETNADCGAAEAPIADGSTARDANVESPSADADVDGNTTKDAAVETATACAFKATYTFHDDGGLRLSADSSTLTPPRSHEIARTTGGGNPATCTRDVPCTSASAVSVAAIEAAVANADVQAALAKPKGALYGGDPRPFDGTVWILARDDGRDFTVGSGDVPAGLRALETLLRQLSTETLAAPECAALSH